MKEPWTSRWRKHLLDSSKVQRSSSLVVSGIGGIISLRVKRIKSVGIKAHQRSTLLASRRFYGPRRIEIDFRGDGSLRNAPRSDWDTVVTLSATQILGGSLRCETKWESAGGWIGASILLDHVWAWLGWYLLTASVCFPLGMRVPCKLAWRPLHLV